VRCFAFQSMLVGPKTITGGMNSMVQYGVCVCVCV
ncbi:MAG: hypothetical protein ACI8RD_012842, partial [Bacillariaceae sp.]